jgi:hypothetical protein
VVCEIGGHHFKIVSEGEGRIFEFFQEISFQPTNPREAFAHFMATILHNKSQKRGGPLSLFTRVVSTFGPSEQLLGFLAKHHLSLPSRSHRRHSNFFYQSEKETRKTLVTTSTVWFDNYAKFFKHSTPIHGPYSNYQWTAIGYVTAGEGI